MGYKILGAEGKSETVYVEPLLKRLFGDLPGGSYRALATVGLNPHCGAQRELDLLLFLSWNPDGRNEFRFRPGRLSVYCIDTRKNRDIFPDETRCFLQSVLASVEIKSHDSRAIRASGNDIYFLYMNQGREMWHCASSALIEQARSGAQFVEHHFGVRDHAGRFIYLPSVKREQLRVSEDLERVLLFADSTYEDFINKLIHQLGLAGYSDRARPRYLGSKWKSLYYENGILQKKIEEYFKQLVPSHLEQTKLEMLTRRYIDSQKWAQSIGKEMVIFMGPAGTGKTVRLLRAARDLADNYLENVLLLTFNRALAGDLQRLMQLQRMNNRTAITVMTIDQFLYRIAFQVGLLDREEVERFKEEHDQSIFEALRSLLPDALEDPDNVARVKEYYGSFTMAAIDEAQDWFEEERRIVLSLFPPNRILIAMGTDQLLRAPEVANWKQDAEKRGVSVTLNHGNKALRQTSNLSDFCNALAAEIGMDWKVERNDQLSGGEVYYFHRFDDAVLPVFLEELIQNNGEYCAIDFLMLQGSARQVTGRVQSRFDLLEQNGWAYWDAVTGADRTKLPEQNMIRNVSLESCRGLEGWATVVFDLDWWMNFTLNREAEFSQRLNFQTLPSWFLIPFTRAKQRILIEMPRDEKLKKTLLRIQEASHGAIKTLN